MRCISLIVLILLGGCTSPAPVRLYDGPARPKEQTASLTIVLDRDSSKWVPFEWVTTGKGVLPPGSPPSVAESAGVEIVEVMPHRHAIGGHTVRRVSLQTLNGVPCAKFASGELVMWIQAGERSTNESNTRVEFVPGRHQLQIAGGSAGSVVKRVIRPISRYFEYRFGTRATEDDHPAAHTVAYDGVIKEIRGRTPFPFINMQGGTVREARPTFVQWRSAPTGLEAVADVLLLFTQSSVPEQGVELNADFAAGCDYTLRCFVHLGELRARIEDGAGSVIAEGRVMLEPKLVPDPSPEEIWSAIGLDKL